MNGKNKLDEYIYLAYLTEPREVGESTKRSPQHLTLVPPFRFGIPLSELKEAVHEVAEGTSTFQIKVAKEAKFGPNHNINVFLVEPADVVKMLHFQLMYKLQSAGVSLPTNYVYDAFVPHIRIRPVHKTNLAEGQLLNVDHLAIMHKNKGYRTLLAKEELRSGQTKV
ncbi:MAG TPA: 2'-5' RNA ligase family protein [Candidatus Nitrosopolaris sp.]|nr:2'-5' RNA ligase family protein [Candidatus Nitrosopolaris sp.]